MNTSASARSYLTAALNLMQEHALERAQLNWQVIRRRAMNEAAGATSPSDTYAAIQSSLARLRVNNHSSLIPPPAPGASTSLAVSPFELPMGKVLSGHVAYIEMPGNSQADAAQYQAAGRAVVTGLRRGDPVGWIIDLRSDTGGDVWPMLGALQPLLGRGLIGSFVAPGHPVRDIRVTPTRLTSGHAVQLMTTAAKQGLSSTPVVELTGSSTASSGELVDIAFRGRPCTTSMGASTAGVPTANRGYRLSDGAILNLTVALEADRTGHVYSDAPIRPATAVGQANDVATWHRNDPATARAARWLTQHSNCRK